ncbi:unnamed protein product [Lactuca virosa]|uniref:ATP-dependent Clp protease proteolytic subunit n=1 Tax=Lactuca virosa TaxID=75947 RepID=A0AAU9MW87_9ASTR|nr:unnamed protein product [Lactuca virosa]
MDRDYFMTPQDAKEFGFIDEVVDERPLTLVTGGIRSEGKGKVSEYNLNGFLISLCCCVVTRTKKGVQRLYLSILFVGCFKSTLAFSLTGVSLCLPFTSVDVVFQAESG